MQLQRFEKAEDFYAGAGRLLAQREAENCLMLGLVASLGRDPGLPPEEPYMATVGEGGEAIAAALMTPPFGLVVSTVARGDPGEVLAPIVDDVRRFRVTPPGVVGPAPVSRAFAELWQASEGQPYRKGTAMRVYRLRRVIPVTGVPGALRTATDRDRELLSQWFAAFNREALGEETNPEQAERLTEAYLQGETRGIYLWEDGRPVSMAGHSGPTPNGVRVNAVYTPPGLRGRGYASACVATLSQKLLDKGRRYCFLFTDLANPTSNRIYRAVGYEAVADVDEYKFP